VTPDPRPGALVPGLRQGFPAARPGTGALTGPHQSHLRLGHARFDITPPAGIYNRLWGAATSDRATGVHRPLFADLIALGRLGEAGPRCLRLELDLCCLMQPWVDEIKSALARAAGVGPDDAVVTFSHTHSAGWLFDPARHGLPGGELVRPYVSDLAERAARAAEQAVGGMAESWIAYGAGRCAMVANRDYLDRDRGLYACGYNPDAPADETLVVGRATDAEGRLVATFVNYGCHPTTLAWENSLLSPDYVGALREEVERSTGAPCVFLLGACGDQGPRVGYVGDTAIADRNGRQVAHAALSVLEGLDPPATELAYRGPVVSGATLGDWRYAPLPAERRARAERFDGGATTVDLPLRPKPDRAQLEAEVERRQAERRAAEAAGRGEAAREAGAMLERARRWLGRLDDLPGGATLPLPFAVYRLGEALWVTCAAEPYSRIQGDLRARFPGWTVLFSPLAGEVQVAYLLPRDRYGVGLYQEEPSILAAGCLERLTEAIADRIGELTRA
jgi:hypothetical protein